MGIEDRDYFWEDRKRREEKFIRDTYYRPKEFRHRRGQKPPDDWKQPPINRNFTALFAFLLGAVISFFSTIVIMHTNPNMIRIVYHFTGNALDIIGIN